MDAHKENMDGIPSDLIQQFLAYPFGIDEEFQQGLAGILNSAGFSERTKSDRDKLLLSSQVFYFNRITGRSITAEDVIKYRDAAQSHVLQEPEVSMQGASSSQPVAEGGEAEPRILSFAELKALIEQGKTDEIPNNRVIPDELNKEEPSESKAAIRRKPWELANPNANGVDV